CAWRGYLRPRAVRAGAGGGGGVVIVRRAMPASPPARRPLSGRRRRATLQHLPTPVSYGHGLAAPVSRAGVVGAVRTLESPSGARARLEATCWDSPTPVVVLHGLAAPAPARPAMLAPPGRVTPS